MRFPRPVIAKQDKRKSQELTLYRYILNFSSGLGKTKAIALCSLLGLRCYTALDALTDKTRIELESLLRLLVGGTLTAHEKKNIDIAKLKALKLRRGLRLASRLPVRGQGTKTNSKTRRLRDVK